MTGARLLNRDETEYKTEGGAKQEGESRKLMKKPKQRLLPIFSPDFASNGQNWLFHAESGFY